MNFVALAVGILLVGAGFVTLIRRLHDRSVQESLVVLNAGRELAPAISAFAGLLAPIVTAIAGGVAFAALGLIGLGA